MNAEEAKDFGIVDDVILKRALPEGEPEEDTSEKEGD